METLNPEMIKKIDAILDRVKDPESGLSVAHLGLVKRVRFSEPQKMLYVFTDFKSHMPGCKTCVFIAKLVADSIIRNLVVEFDLEFPDLQVEFV
jgi:metal-sulfur cluster biosynthetic enzyme